jgi:hypothetical protein
MLEAVPTSLFAKKFRLEREKSLIGELDNSLWRERATLELEEGTYDLVRERSWTGDFLLERNGHVIARATKPSVFRSRFIVDDGSHHVELRRLSMFTRRFGIFEDRKQIGMIYPATLFSRRASIDLPTDWPASTRAFLYWLTYLMWRRENGAGSA